MEPQIVVGDVTERPVDAVVNSTDTELAITGEVGIAFYQALGQEFLDAAIEAAPIGVGDTAVTPLHELDVDDASLPADAIIHAAVMLHDAGQKPTEESIRRCTESVLETAEECGYRSIAIPALGCGVGGFDLEAGARIITEAIREHDPDALEQVEFVVIDRAAAATVREA